MSAMADGGLAAVHIEGLAQRLGVTKGSFYWHYDGRDDLIAAALERWCEDALEVLARVAQWPQPHDRLRELARQSVGEWDSIRVEVALAGVVDDERVTRFLERVTERRIALLRETFAMFGDGDPHDRAVVAHALFVGYLHTVRVAPARRVDLASLIAAWQRM